MLDAAKRGKQGVNALEIPSANKVAYDKLANEQIAKVEEAIKDLHVAYGKQRYEEEELKDKLVGEDMICLLGGLRGEALGQHSAAGGPREAREST